MENAQVRLIILSARYIPQLYFLIYSCSILRLRGEAYKVTSSNAFGWQHWCGAWYRLTTVPKDWPNAKKSRRRVGGVLAAPRSHEENAVMFDLMLRVGRKSFCINCNNFENVASWRCNDELVSPNYTNWAPDEPSSFNHHTGDRIDAENCAEMLNKYGFTGEWNDFPCRMTRVAVCKMSIEGVCQA
ncbi:pulmonary surfactant-associated protein D-like [Asterias rubens]|uniref:pulmonary surfactant-associated protein D-like n=1 Tax=Asterias rubens TaxID=7604 RepID=UPI001454E90E|nr:pulmonary surfactant-associated protein D-like [Asterias rubens]